MVPLEVLSEALIDTLSEFSAVKRPITKAALTEALSARKDILSLLRPEPEKREPQKSSTPGRGPARVSLPKSEAEIASLTAKDISRVDGPSNGAGQGLTAPGGEGPAPESEPFEVIPKLRNFFFRILNSLVPAIPENYESRLYKLQKEITECQSLRHILLFGEQIATIIIESIDRSMERVQYSNDFLVELSKDLCQMEEQLSAFHVYNHEYNKISSDFHEKLLSHTDDLNSTLTSGMSQPDIRTIISSKLITISKAIEIKKQSDTDRLREADTKIEQLQNNLSIYNKEIVQVTKRAESLEKVVMLDELTQINNRRAYDLQIREELRRYHRGGDKLSLILIDIDHFKRVNDAHGHIAGDKCLKEIAQILKSSLRQSDFVARYGGEELIAIIHGIGSANAWKVAEKVRDGVEKTRFHYQEEIIHVTVSLGVTEVLPHDTDPEEPFKRVDEALYQAKEAGRNRIRVI
jgi:diguanylate cyclase